MRRCTPVLLFALLSFRLSAQDSPWTLQPFGFGLESDPYAYIFTYRPSLRTIDGSLGLKLGYGNRFENDLVPIDDYLDSLVFAGGLTAGIGGVSAELEYRRGVPVMPFAEYGLEQGFAATITTKTGGPFSLSASFFKGELSQGDADLKASTYVVVTAFGSIYRAIEHSLSYRFELAMPVRPETDPVAFGFQHTMRADWFDRRISNTVTFGWLRPGNDEAGYGFDYHSFGRGVPAGSLRGDSFAATEHILRVFPLADVYDLPFLSSMLYVFGFFKAGVYLPRKALVEYPLGSYTAGGGIGMMFFATDAALSVGWDRREGFVFSFTIVAGSIESFR